MFLKKGYKLFVKHIAKNILKYTGWTIAFVIGCVVTYILCQWSYLKIDTEINAADMIVSSLGLALGIYIVVIIDGKKNRNQNFYSYVEGKFDTLWQEFISFSEKLEFSPSMELVAISKDFKSLDKKTGPLKKIFEASDYDSSCITSIEKRLESLNDNLSSSDRIENNIVDLDFDRDKLIAELDSINELFAKSYKTLNHIS